MTAYPRQTAAAPANAHRHPTLSSTTGAVIPSTRDAAGTAVCLSPNAKPSRRLGTISVMTRLTRRGEKHCGSTSHGVLRHRSGAPDAGGRQRRCPAGPLDYASEQGRHDAAGHEEHAYQSAEDASPSLHLHTDADPQRTEQKHRHHRQHRDREGNRNRPPPDGLHRPVTLAHDQVLVGPLASAIRTAVASGRELRQTAVPFVPLPRRAGCSSSRPWRSAAARRRRRRPC